MRLKNMFLCDAATANHDNTFSVLRGGISALNFVVPPNGDLSEIRPFQLTLVATIELDSAEMGQEHQVVLIFMDIDGKRVLPDIHTSFQPPHSPHKGYFNLIINSMLKVMRPGEYHFYVNVDGQELGTQPLTVSFHQTSSPQLPS